MTLQEILRAQSLTDEQIEKVIGEMKQNKIFTAGEENLDIRYNKLKTDHDNLANQHKEATSLIEQLKAGTKDSEALQGKITSYESTIANLQNELKQTRLDNAVKVALLEAKVTDVDYMAFRLREKGDLELDEQGKVKGIDDRLAGLKTQFPAFFESAAMQRELQPHTLPDRNIGSDKTVTKEEFEKMGYNSRVQLKEAAPEVYNQLMKG